MTRQPRWVEETYWGGGKVLRCSTRSSGAWLSVTFGKTGLPSGAKICSGTEAQVMGSSGRMVLGPVLERVDLRIKGPGGVVRREVVAAHETIPRQ